MMRERDTRDVDRSAEGRRHELMLCLIAALLWLLVGYVFLFSYILNGGVQP